jgi:Putative transposase
VVCSKRPFGGPEAVLAYLSRYTHRVAISNSRLLACGAAGVAFKYKDYRVDGHARQKVMRLATDEFIRRFLIHVLPTGFHRIRHYGLFASGARAHNIAHARELLDAPIPCEQDKRPDDGDQPEPRVLAHPCPCCGGRMIVIETFERGRAPRADGARPMMLREKYDPIADREHSIATLYPSKSSLIVIPTARQLKRATLKSP